MKSINIKTTLFVAAIALIFTLIACNADSLLKDVNIEIGTELLYNPINLQVMDARMDGTIPQNATVTITGKDKDKVFSVFGEKALSVNSEGLLNIAIPRSSKPTNTSPLQFMVSIKVPGYMEARKNIVIYDATKTQLEEVRMVNLSTPPKGISIESNTVIPVDAATGVIQPIIVSTPTLDGKIEDATIKIASGTKMFDKNGNSVSGDVKMTFVHFDAVNESSLNSFPGGFNVIGAKDTNGNVLADDVFTSLGFIAVSMEVGGKEVKTFSQPLDMEVEVNPNVYSPFYNRNIQAGDSIPVWSLNETTGTWDAETMASVKEQNGKLKASFKQKHLSYWNLDFLQCSGSCSRCYGSALITSNITKNGTLFYTEISLASNPNIKLEPWCYSPSDYLRNGSKVDFNTVPNNTKFILKVYDKPGGLLLYTSPSFNPCLNPTLDLRGKLPINQIPPTINLNFSALCSGTVKATIYPTVIVYYKEVGVDMNWRVLGTISNGKGTTTGLIPGKKYKFGIFHGSLSRTTDDLGLKDGFVMPTGDAVIPINSKVYSINETLNIKKVGDSYSLNYLNFPVSDKLCTDFKKYF